MKTKQERFTLFVERLVAASAVGTHDEAFELICETLDGVEDEFSGIAANPATFQTDGRMYPPQPDSARRVPGQQGTIRYRSKAHNTIIGSNGAIRIETIGPKRTIVLEKLGANGEGLGI
ncbi:hypothetical protein J2W42_006790 [Rhizobium tibeticum]|uniref:Uncharacterized protein n=1 Tax=Rhizobium tibeticum TaxID=501024 RepID=A0A1H8WKI1_9HYPH|nr:hypothetical protein [Rhizobium tibeticum]MDP9813913.1 hypothetical protein [Rhizobium tibeticum]SEI20754.1 hypothetical protein RTCCBAU85039_6466 [Rhizobium tibeticum]SEP27598.1 hypothetical protein SAMN05216228_106612 [Rhizobium tibeticum]